MPGKCLSIQFGFRYNESNYRCLPIDLWSKSTIDCLHRHRLYSKTVTSGFQFKTRLRDCIWKNCKENKSNKVKTFSLLFLLFLFGDVQSNSQYFTNEIVFRNRKSLFTARNISFHLRSFFFFFLNRPESIGKSLLSLEFTFRSPCPHLPSVSIWESSFGYSRISITKVQQ